MFSTNRTEVIVVAPEHYSSLARRMVHEISKHQDTKAVFWTTSKYNANEPTQSGDRPVIFIGNADENKFTESYLECIDELKEDDGAVYGSDASRAIIYGKGSLDKNYFDIVREGKFVIAGKSISLSSAIPFAAPLVVGGAGYKYYKLKKEDQKHRANQVDHGIKLFLDEALEDWLEIEHTENK